MKEFRYVITDEQGLHARPAGILVKQAAGYRSRITIKAGSKEVDAKRIFGVMGLGIKQGNEIIMKIDGEDGAKAAGELETFFKEHL